MKNSVAESESFTPSHFRTSLEPALSAIVRVVLPVSTDASPETLILELLAVNVIEFTVRLPVMEIFRTEQRFLKFSSVSFATATIGSAPSAMLPAL